MFENSSQNAFNPDHALDLRYLEALGDAYRVPSVENFAAVARDFPEPHLRNVAPHLALTPLAEAKRDLEPEAIAFTALLLDRVDVAAEAICQKVRLLMDNCGPEDVATANQARDAQYLLGTIMTTPKIAQGILGAILSAVLGGGEFEKRFAPTRMAPAASPDTTIH
jgi:hypothetical protein